MEHGALGKFHKHLAVSRGGFLRVTSGRPEIGFGIGETVAFELNGLPQLVLADENEVPVIRNQDLPVFAPVAANLLSVRGKPGVVGCGLDLDNATIRDLRQRFLFTALGL